MPTTPKGISDNQGRLHQYLARTGDLWPYRPFGYNQKENQENCYILLLLFGWNISCSAGVEAESELESESIFSGRSRSGNWSRLKFVDSAALQKSSIDLSQLAPPPIAYMSCQLAKVMMCISVCEVHHLLLCTIHWCGQYLAYVI